MEAAPGRGCGECPARCAPQGAAKGTGCSSRGSGEVPLAEDPPMAPAARLGHPLAAQNPGGGPVPSAFPLPPHDRTLARPSPAAPLALGLGAPGPLRGGRGLLRAPLSRGVLPLRCGARLDGGRGVLGTEAAFLGHPTLSCYPMAMEGVPVGPGGGPAPPPKTPPASLFLQVPPKPCSCSPALHRDTPVGLGRAQAPAMAQPGPPSPAGRKITWKGSSHSHSIPLPSRGKMGQQARPHSWGGHGEPAKPRCCSAPRLG